MPQKRSRHRLLLMSVCPLLLGTVACGTPEAPDIAPPDETEGSSSDGEDRNDEAIPLEDPILTYFLGADEDRITLNISEARATYMIEEQGADAVNDALYTLHVERAEALDIVNIEEESVSVEDMHGGDKVYVEYDIEEYMTDEEAVVEADRLVVDDIDAAFRPLS
ncbi:hypothetical protein [Shouchella shacheensis]|uniref:hypothetical protein n=1 Tax=Shouchella shacheensis TaxID=1649580 RepID=UPI000740290C|nr:hypothetical protein [Shouchella shacheensis]